MIDVPERTRDHVAILGFTQHNYEAPWGHPAWDFWGLNDLHSLVVQHWPGIFASGQVSWFQLHRKGADGQYPGARDPRHTKWLTEQSFPIYMWAHDPDIPASVPYPIEQALTHAVLPTGEPLSPEQYWNNSISWMIALAILRGYRTIGLYGVDMAMDGVHGESEYAFQRPSVEYFIGVARGLGIRVTMPQQSEILKCGYLYGWDNMTHLRKKILTRQNDLLAGEAEAVDHYEQSKRALFQVLGAKQLLTGECGPLLAGLRRHIPESELKQALEALSNDENKVTNDNEAAKRSLHEVRGALNYGKWLLRNYLPGDGPIQDVPRSDASVMLDPLPAEPKPSDGQSVNRMAEIVDG